MNVLDLCAGIGGMSLGLRLAEPEARTVCYVEREAFSCAHLVAKMQEGLLDAAPLWSDLCTFDGKAWRGKVDLITAGFPCQPHSVAGKRRAQQDDRWIFDDILKIVNDAEPPFVFFENVPGLRTSGLNLVLQGLSRLGFDARWNVFSAAGVGAPHLRKRLFIFGANSNGLRQLQSERCQPVDRGRFGDMGQEMADSNGERLERRTLSTECQNQLSAGQSGLEQGEWWQSEPTMGRLANGVSDRVDRLRALGNAVVPVVVAIAWKELTRDFSG